MNQEGRKHLGERRLPGWLALLLVLLLGGGAIWGILKLMGSVPPKVEAVAVNQSGSDSRDRRDRAAAAMNLDQARRSRDTANQDRRQRGPITNPIRRGVASNQVVPQHAKVYRRPDGVIRVLSDNLVLILEPRESGGEVSLEYLDPENWLTRQQLAVLRIAERSQQWEPGSQGAQRAIELTDEQRKQSKLVVDDPEIRLDDSDRAKLDQLARAWESAADAQKPAGEDALLEGLREVAKKNMKAARQEYLANIDKLASMLTPLQMEQYQRMQGGPRRGRNG